MQGILSDSPTTRMMKQDLKRNFMLSHLSEEQLDRVAHHATRLHLRDGETLFRQNDPASRFYLLLDGQIKLFRLGPHGNEKVIEILMPPTTFAEAIMFFREATFPVGAQALRPAEVISIDAADFALMMHDSVDACFSFMGEMSHRLHAMIREIDELSLRSATCRVAAYFASHTRSDNNSFDLDVPKQVLASRLSVQPETLSRIVRNLSDQGILESHGAHIDITDPDGLQRIAGACAPIDDSLTDVFNRNDTAKQRPIRDA